MSTAVGMGSIALSTGFSASQVRALPVLLRMES